MNLVSPSSLPPNSKAALLRLLTMGALLEERGGDRRLRALERVVLAQGLPLSAMLEAREEYDIALRDAPPGPKFVGNPRLPRSLVTEALDLIQGERERLDVAHLLYDFFTADGPPSRDEVLFVETAVGYWGIGEQWRAWLGAPGAKKKDAQ